MAKNTTPSIITTERYLQGAFDEFGENYQESISHQFETITLEANDTVQTPHTLFVQAKHEVTPDFEAGRMRSHGARHLKLELRGNRTACEKKDGDFSHYTRASIVMPGPTGEVKPLLASAFFSFNTKRTLDFNGTVYFDGHAAGIEDEAVEEYKPGAVSPNLLLGYFKRVAHNRSASVHSVADATMDVSLGTGQSRRTIRSTMNLTDLLRTNTGNDRGDWMRATYNFDEQLTPGFHEAFSKLTSRFVIDRHPKNQRLITNFSRLTLRAASVEAEPLLDNVFDPEEYDFVHDGWVYTPTTGFQACVSSYDVATDVMHFTPDKNVQKSSETAEDEAEARAMVQPFINAVTQLRRLQNAKV